MRRICFLLPIIFIIPLLAKSNEVEDHVNITAEFVMLKREKIRNRCIVAEDVPFEFKSANDCCNPVDSCRCSTKDLVEDMNYEPGLRAALSILPDQKTTWEGRYMGFFFWKGICNVKGDDNLRFPFITQVVPFINDNGTIDYFDADTAHAIYTSRFWSSELNYWRHVAPRRITYFSLSWVFGGRYMELDEKFKVTFQKDQRKSDYRTRTHNHLVGAQTGIDFQVNPYDRITWGLALKIGGLANIADQKSSLRDDNNSVQLRSANPHGSNFCFLFDGAGFISYYPSSRFFVRISYEVLFLSDVALAPNQLGFTSSGSNLEDKGAIILHGGFLGLGVNF